MKNREEILREAKEEIISTLDICNERNNIYKYTEDGIDMWLDQWEQSCSKQIENIAEKSPYYDGKCKIVFPSEFSREIDVCAIQKFCNWLYGLAERNLTQTTIDGFTYRDTYDALNIIKCFNKVIYDNERVNPELFAEEIKVAYASLLNSWDSKDGIYHEERRIRRIREAFHSSEIRIESNGKAYLTRDYIEFGINEARVLAQILTNSYAHTQLITEGLKRVLDEYFTKCRFSVGQKLSRAVNNIAAKYGINKDKEWNKEFAKFADAINPLTVTKWTVLSWHPVDYLRFCWGNSWSTCSNIDKDNVRGVKIGNSKSSITSYVDEEYVFRGEHAAAALSYMFDETSFVYYTLDHKYEGSHYELQDKETRIMFSFDDNTLLQSRLYPQCNDDSPNDDNYRVPREIVQKVIADALDVPNLWKVKKGTSVCCDYAISTGVHYTDYTDTRNKKCNISWFGEAPKRIYLGHNAICPDCGCVHDYVGSLNCRDCDPRY